MVDTQPFAKLSVRFGYPTLTIQVTNTDGSYVVVDAFDVRP